MLVKGLKHKNREQIQYILFRNVPMFAQQDLLHQVGIEANSVQILNGYPCVDSFVFNLILQPGEKSGVIKFDEFSKT